MEASTLQKRCPRCQKVKSISEFHRNRGSYDGLNTYCKLCQKEYYQGKKDEAQAYARAHSRLPDCRARRQKRNRSVKVRVLTHYSNGNPKCNQCGISDLDVLCIDHVANNGNTHRKNVGVASGITFYQWLINNNFPDGFQALCANCNLKKELIQRKAGMRIRKP